MVVDVVGLPAVGWSGLGEAERDLVTSAEVLLGAPRHLGLVPEVEGQERHAWPSPLRPQLPGFLDAYSDRRVVALASGDPLVAGIGSTLVDLLGTDAVRVHPAVSSVALAGARMGWDAATFDVVRIASEGAQEVRPLLAPGRRLVALSRDAGTPAAIAGVLGEAGFGLSVVTVLGDLGTPAETRRESLAATGVDGEVPALNVVCVACATDQPEADGSPVPGLPDDAYENDGQLSKRVVRAAALAHLRPSGDELLWDLGAGAGSVAIEWCRAVRGSRAIAVERDGERAARITRNARHLGVPGLQVISGVNADALTWLPAPDAVFVGGGADTNLLHTVLSMIKPGGRLVVHAVTVETETLLLDLHASLGGELARLSVESLGPLGRFRGWVPARPVVQWSLVTPSADGTRQEDPAR
ncbi:precorrin-6y C5,15-methyltransferase (decarboxylating) subunit CbiE [Microlunatus sagamiharensis]|uniref:precorrin-6y C5,15-methyltransferase (decarboxylating) subunit CbiE n=1 Tax=Microlunatus sagamiharensis TaxID=546874 RepID=UPI0018D2C199|nr:precorrin-6y C5,15-methyltransferase (decarboxylating) subunit CbiE [Microlunatus sagamiharensis]